MKRNIICVLIILSFCLLTGCGDKTSDVATQEAKNLKMLTDEGDETPLSTDEYEEDIWENSHFVYEATYMDPDDEDEEELLIQKKPDGTITEQIRFGKLALLSSGGDYVEILAITDKEIICTDEEDTHFETGALYCIPLSFHDGKEEVLYDKKEVIWKGSSDVTKPLLFVACIGDYILCDGAKRECIEFNRHSQKTVSIGSEKNEEYRYYSDVMQGYCYTGEYILCSRYIEKEQKGIYVHKVGTKTAEPVIESDAEGTMIAVGEGKFYYTDLIDAAKNSLYDVWQYDCEQKKNRKILTREQIEDILPEKPSAGCDLIRAMKVAEGKLYIEIRYADKVHVVSYDGDTEVCKLENGIRELVRHKEYKLDTPIADANERYTSCNDHNLYSNNQTGGLVERQLDGTYVRTIRMKGGHFLYANNEELIVAYPDEEQVDVLYSVPLRQIDGNDYPDFNKKEKLVKIGEGYYTTIWDGELYADRKYLVFMTNDHDFQVFDRQKKTFITITNDPPERHTFGVGTILNNRCGDYFVFNTKPFGKKEEEYGFSYYRMGDKKVTRIDPQCYTAADYICDSARGQIIYERAADIGKKDWKNEIWRYDMKSGGKKRLFSMSEWKKVLEKNGVSKGPTWFYSRWYVYQDRLYIVGSTVLSLDLKDCQEVRLEKEMMEQMKEGKRENVSSLGIVEGKLLTMKVDVDEDGEEIAGTERYFCFDMETKEGKELTDNDPECLYLSLVEAE